MGVADHCKEYYYDVVLNGKIVERRGFACLMKGKDYESSVGILLLIPLKFQSFCGTTESRQPITLVIVR